MMFEFQVGQIESLAILEALKQYAENKDNKDRAMKAASQRTQNQRILEIMADKQDAALKEKSIEELQNMLIAENIDDEE